MIDFHSYLLKHHSGFELLAGADTTRVATYPIGYYSQYVTVLCQHRIFLFKDRDAETFLQGQLCGDIKQCSDEQAIYTAHCTHQGRVFATLILSKEKDGFQAICPSSNASVFFDRLKKYILFSKVTLSAPTQQPILLECSGPDTEAALRAFFPSLPNLPMTRKTNDALSITRLHGEQPRWLLEAKTHETAIACFEALVSTHCPVGLLGRQRQLVEASIVEVGLELQEAFLPQMIDLDRLGGLSLKKGCYVGQEVIARTSHLGKLKRHLYRMYSKGKTQSCAGIEITDSSGSVLGTVAQAFYCEESNQTQVLAVLADRGLQEELRCAGEILTLA